MKAFAKALGIAAFDVGVGATIGAAIGAGLGVVFELAVHTTAGIGIGIGAFACALNIPIYDRCKVFSDVAIGSVLGGTIGIVGAQMLTFNFLVSPQMETETPSSTTHKLEGNCEVDSLLIK